MNEAIIEKQDGNGHYFTIKGHENLKFYFRINSERSKRYIYARCRNKLLKMVTIGWGKYKIDIAN